MPKASPIQTNFTAGELSPRLAGRVDLAKYANGLKTLSNMIIHPHGGVTRRGGTSYIGDTKTDGIVRLVPFEFSTTQAYMLEFGDSYIRFYKDQTQIESGGTPVEITTTYTATDIFELQYVQSADTLYIVHPNHPPATLTRSSHTAWTLANITFTAQPSEWVASNYPAATAFFEQRLWFAGNPDNPQTLWGSKSGIFTDMTAGTAADDAVAYTISTDQVNKIQWMAPTKVLTVGTAGGEFIVSASSLEEAITPTNIRIVRQSSYGSSYQLPAVVSSVVLFVQRAGRKIREFVFNFASDSYVAPDLTILSEHITNSGIKQIAYQQEADSLLWVLLNNGELAGLTYQRDQEVVGWHSHVLAGVSDTDGTASAVESIAVIPSPDGTIDELWLSVKRYINGATVRHVEVMTAGLLPESNIEKSFFVDSGLIYSGAATNTISGLDHLEGEQVSILADGSSRPGKTVVSGGLTIDGPAATYVVAGLSFNSDLETLQPEAGSADGTAQGKIKRISRVNVRLYRTVGLLVGSSADNLDRIPFRSSANNMDEAVEPFTGDKEIQLPAGWGKEGAIYIRQNQPLPMTVLAIMPKIKTNG